METVWSDMGPHTAKPTSVGSSEDANMEPHDAESSSSDNLSVDSFATIRDQASWSDIPQVNEGRDPFVVVSHSGSMRMPGSIRLTTPERHFEDWVCTNIFFK